MPEALWVGLVLVGCWAALPVSLIIALKDFDHGVVTPGDHHH